MCIYIYIYLYTYIHIYIYMYMYTYFHPHTPTHTQVTDAVTSAASIATVLDPNRYIYIYICVYMHIYIYMYTYIHTYIHIYIHVYAFSPTYTHAHTGDRCRDISSVHSHSAGSESLGNGKHRTCCTRLSARCVCVCVGEREREGIESIASAAHGSLLVVREREKQRESVCVNGQHCAS